MSAPAVYALNSELKEPPKSTPLPPGPTRHTYPQPPAPPRPRRRSTAAIAATPHRARAVRRPTAAAAARALRCPTPRSLLDLSAPSPRVIWSPLRSQFRIPLFNDSILRAWNGVPRHAADCHHRLPHGRGRDGRRFNHPVRLKLRLPRLVCSASSTALPPIHQRCHPRAPHH